VPITGSSVPADP